MRNEVGNFEKMVAVADLTGKELQYNYKKHKHRLSEKHMHMVLNVFYVAKTNLLIGVIILYTMRDLRHQRAITVCLTQQSFFALPDQCSGMLC